MEYTDMQNRPKRASMRWGGYAGLDLLATLCVATGWKTLKRFRPSSR